MGTELNRHSAVRVGYSHLGSPMPSPSKLVRATGLEHAYSPYALLEEEVGFEPTDPLITGLSFSRRARSATPPFFREGPCRESPRRRQFTSYGLVKLEEEVGFEPTEPGLAGSPS